MSTTINNYQVEGYISPIQQPNGMACWATVATMLLSWRDQQSYTIETAMDIAGQKYRDLFDSREGLSAEDHEDFASASGMTIEYPQCYSPEGIYNLLVSYGPVIAIDDEDESEFFAIHARVINGIETDGFGNVSLNIIDPGTGSEYSESFESFASKFEAVDGAPRIQVMHF
ncbi:papain-like cysteine protease family protein [Pedobacter antarcticus]|uniref:papain-like cysteine protease family protein n=1 Tax=Pedobacter antarcticus TaxID=34086 RepID=UPI000891D36E|nr:papain-like cysteine protease family protein [Pedobacter antarcticus]SDM37457.1 Papain-like cysteine protease AvrRpt2 [Pedobacter antarcticus]